MKKVFRILSLLLCILLSGTVTAQPLLRVTVAYFTPDSTGYSTISNLTYIVENMGGTPFSGEVDIHLGTPLIGTDSVDNFLISLAPGDTVSRTSGVLVTPARFNIGDNTVIIWPTARPTSGGSFEGVADTTILHVLSGTSLDASESPSLISWSQSPDNILSISHHLPSSVRVGEVRITDILGRSVPFAAYDNTYHTLIPVYGIIVAELRLSDGRIWRKRISCN